MSLNEKLFPSFVSYTNSNETLFSVHRITKFALSFIQLAALLLIVNLLNIEKNSGISSISYIILIAFTLNNFSKLRYRPALLFSTSIVIIYHAFGFFSGSLLIIAGFSIIACCHLPIKFWMRILLVLIITLGMIILRADLFLAPRAALVVPFIASMFMFRTIIYLYALKHTPYSSTFFQKLSYFFLFPNQCFLLFPIIDYKTYLNTYYNKPDTEIWQKGIRWILRGVIHLIGYRIIYYHFLINPNDVNNLTSLLQYVLFSYALILRLSGLFHFIVGLLCLFGLNLPPAFNNYLLATSFVNLWQRINTYWREFMMKIFFYPILFKYKKLFSKNLLAITMLSVFFVTWFMHNYQWFWIRGNFPLTSMDILFWATLGICITINSVWLEKRSGGIKKEMNTVLAYSLAILKMMGLFLFMSVLWSLWGSNSIQEWLFLLSKGKNFSTHELILVFTSFIAILLLGIGFYYLLSKENIKKIFSIEPEHTLKLTLPTIALLLILCTKQVHDYLPYSIKNFIESISEEKLNNIDKENTEGGYYKKLIDGENTSTSGLWETQLKRPKTFTSIDEIAISTNDLLLKKFKPNCKTKVNDYTIETNAFGLRDKNYDSILPANTIRIALLGGSYEMGSGVSNNETYEYLTEEMLNKNNTDSSIRSIEIFNFAVGGYHLAQQVELCNTTVFKYNPQVLIYVAHTNEAKRFLGFFADNIRNGTDLKYPFLINVKQLSGVKQSMSKIEIQDRLRPYIYTTIKWCYSEIIKNCQKNNTTPIWAFLPATADVYDEEEYQKIKDYAVQMGFTTLDLRTVYNGLDKTKIRISEWDTHPNADGHKIIANKFYTELVKNKTLILQNKK